MKKYSCTMIMDGNVHLIKNDESITEDNVEDIAVKFSKINHCALELVEVHL